MVRGVSSGSIQRDIAAHSYLLMYIIATYMLLILCTLFSSTQLKGMPLSTVQHRWCIIQAVYCTGGVLYTTGDDCIIQVVYYTGGGSAGSIQRQAASGSWEKQWMQGGK